MTDRDHALQMGLRRILRQSLTPPRLLVLSFVGLILLGSLLLRLPQATTSAPLDYVDALFTATSATCVTGLVVADTGTKFTPAGQLIILCLIQLGGLGIMTFSTAFLYVLEGRLSLASRAVLEETLTQSPMRGLRGLLKTVFAATFLIESAGALILTLRFAHYMPWAPAVYQGIFHSISAFCNAGFALQRNSLTPYQGDAIINLTIICLIVLGGLGFVVIYELFRLRRRNRYRLSFNTRLVLTTSGVLIAGGAAFFFVLEYANALRNQPWPAKILISLFQSVTTRTAGFNSVEIGVLSNPTLFMMIVLMFIGASPASCGGGIKTTTFAVILSHIRARFNSGDHSNLFLRRIASKTVSKAITITFFAALVIMLCTMLLLITELAEVSHQASRGLFLELLFEVTSAFGTVGLSLGTTPTLSAAGKMLIILVMLIGRLGPLTIAMAVGRKEQAHFKFAEEDVLVG